VFSFCNWLFLICLLTVFSSIRAPTWMALTHSLMLLTYMAGRPWTIGWLAFPGSCRSLDLEHLARICHHRNKPQTCSDIVWNCFSLNILFHCQCLRGPSSNLNYLGHCRNLTNWLNWQHGRGQLARRLGLWQTLTTGWQSCKHSAINMWHQHSIKQMKYKDSVCNNQISRQVSPVQSSHADSDVKTSNVISPVTTNKDFTQLTLWHPLLPYGYSYKASGGTRLG